MHREKAIPEAIFFIFTQSKKKSWECMLRACAAAALNSPQSYTSSKLYIKVSRIPHPQKL